MTDLITYAEAADLCGVPIDTVRQWKSRHRLEPAAYTQDAAGRLRAPLFRPEDVQRANQEALDCPAGRHRKGESK